MGVTGGTRSLSKPQVDKEKEVCYTMDMVLVQWHDARSGGDGWLNAEDIPLRPAVYQSIGWKYYEDEKCIVLAQTQFIPDEYSEVKDYLSSTTIPKGCITYRKKLKCEST